MGDDSILEKRPDTKRQKRKLEEKVSEEEFENMVSKREKIIQDEIRLRNLQKSDTEKSKLETEKMLFKSINQNDTTSIPMELDNHPSVDDEQKIVNTDKFEPSRVKKSEIIYHDGGDD